MSADFPESLVGVAVGQVEVLRLSVVLYETAIVRFCFFKPVMNGLDSAYLLKKLGRFFMVLPERRPQGLVQSVSETLNRFSVLTMLHTDGFGELQRSMAWFGKRLSKLIQAGRRGSLPSHSETNKIRGSGLFIIRITFNHWVIFKPLVTIQGHYT
jgi:hypothetical protein